jgi:hypothetical protein
MQFPKALFRGVNRCLAPLGVAVERVSRDFDARLSDPGQLIRMHRAFGRAWAEWLADQSVIRVRAEIDAEREAALFYEAYLRSPYREQSGGSRYNNLLLLFLIGKTAAPSVIVDSGTDTGASAWALRLSCPDARVLSFDIDLSRLRLRAPGVEYNETDWTAFDWSGLPTGNGLCYFDDHVDQARRLLETAERGFPSPSSTTTSRSRASPRWPETAARCRRSNSSSTTSCAMRRRSPGSHMARVAAGAWTRSTWTGRGP